MLTFQAALLAERSRVARAALAHIGRESLIVFIFHLLGVKVLSTIAVFAFGVPTTVLYGRAWWLQAVVAIVFSLFVAAVIRRVPLARAVFYPRTRSGSLRLAVRPAPAR